MYIKPHNKTAYKRISEMLKTKDMVCSVAPTGTGKSYHALQLIENNKDKRILFLTSYLPITEQFKELCAKNLELNDIDTAVYAGQPALIRAGKTYDYIFLDEFHRCGAPVWQSNLRTLLEQNPNAKVIGFSATPIRYLDDARNMAEELFEGNVAYELSLAEAAAKGILPGFEYIGSVYSLETEVQRLEKKYEKCKEKHDKEYVEALLKKAKTKLHEANGLPDMFKKHIKNSKGKYVMFCPDIERLNLMADEDWFSEVNKSINKYIMHSQKKNNINTLKQFLNDDSDALKILYCVGMLNEGVHSEGIDGVIMMRSTTSPNIFLQQMGRALTTGAKKPQIFDVAGNIESLFTAEKLQLEIEELTSKEKRPLDISFEIYAEIRETLEVLRELNAVLTFGWDDWFALAEEYYKKHGHLDIPKNYEVGGPPLGTWVNNQRQKYKNEKLSEDQISKLKSIGMIWNTYEARWDAMFVLAKKYYRKYGHLVVPKKEEYEGKPLGQWINVQRTAYRNKKLDETKIRKLISIGMVWNTLDAQWEKMFILAKQYYERHGNLDIPKGYKVNDELLGKWVNTQRQAYKNEKLDEERIKKLNSVGMIWNTFEAKWEKMFATAKDYYKRNGNLNIPQDNESNKILSSWIRRQRRLYREKKLDKSRIDKLESIGMIWS